MVSSVMKISHPLSNIIGASAEIIFAYGSLVVYGRSIIIVSPHPLSLAPIAKQAGKLVRLPQTE